MTVTITHTLNMVEVNALLHSPARGATRDLIRRGNKVLSRAKELCPVDSGRLRSSLNMQLVQTGGGDTVCRIGSNLYYARWVHDGTGLYGPRHRRIVPVRAAFLVFTPKGSSRVVFARSVAGMRGTPYLKNALPAFRG